MGDRRGGVGGALVAIVLGWLVAVPVLVGVAVMRSNNAQGWAVFVAGGLVMCLYTYAAVRAAQRSGGRRSGDVSRTRAIIGSSVLVVLWVVGGTIVMFVALFIALGEAFDGEQHRLNPLIALALGVGILVLATYGVLRLTRGERRT